MPKFIRRSLLHVNMIEMTLPKAVLTAESDALVLNLETLPAEILGTLAPSAVLSVINSAQDKSLELFARFNRNSAHMLLEAAVWPGLTGVVFANAEHPEDIIEVDSLLSELECRRGLEAQSIQVIAEIGTAMGICNSLDIARSSTRLTGIAVIDTSLCNDLGIDIEANLEKDPLRFMKAQVIVTSNAAGIPALGMSYPLSITLEQPEDGVLQRAVRRARDMGFKGAICPHTCWIRSCNEGFRPTEDEVSYYRKARELFADGLRRGLASVPFEGRMIDVPVDRRAKAFLQWDEMCKQRDSRKVGGR